MRIGRMSALSNDETEIYGGTADAIVRPRLSPGPCGAAWPQEFDEYIVRWHRSPTYRVTEWPGQNPNMCHVPQTRGGGTGKPERIHNILPVRPGFHQPCRGK